MYVSTYQHLPIYNLSIYLKSTCIYLQSIYLYLYMHVSVEDLSSLVLMQAGPGPGKEATWPILPVHVIVSATHILLQ